MNFVVKKTDEYNKHDACYIVKASSKEEALKKVNLAPADLQELNKDYELQPYPRYGVEVEEINFTDGVYKL